MDYIKRIGLINLIMLLLCLAIVLFAEYLFLIGEQIHAIFVGLWAPTLLGVLIYFRLVNNGK
jgi:hypothetical protein